MLAVPDWMHCHWKLNQPGGDIQLSAVVGWFGLFFSFSSLGLLFNEKLLQY